MKNQLFESWFESIQKRLQNSKQLLDVATETGSSDTPEKRREILDDLNDIREIAELQQKIRVVEARRMYRREKRLSAQMPDYDRSAVDELMIEMSQDELREVLDNMTVGQIKALQQYINQEYEEHVENRRRYISDLVDRLTDHNNDNKSLT